MKDSVAPDVRAKAEDIRLLCERYGVQSLELFGSATGGDFREDSDLDFLVEFLDQRVEGYFNRYFGLLEGLQDLFGRKVDLVVPSAITNPYFQRSVDESRVPLYAA